MDWWDLETIINMQKYISPFNNILKILHFPGTRTLNKKIPLIGGNKFTQFSVPKNVTIITTANDTIKGSALLLKQLKNANVNFINCVPDGTYNWNNRFKIKFLLDALKTVKTKYCLILDSLDVAIVSDLKDIVNIYKSYNVQTLYNGTTAEFPDVTIENIPNRIEKFGPYSFFNAGCCIGTTKSLIKIYLEANDIVNATDLEGDKHANSEQYFMRKVFANHLEDNLIGIDWQCKIFQCWHDIQPDFVMFDSNLGFVQKLYSSTNQKLIESLKPIKHAQAAVDTDLTDDL